MLFQLRASTRPFSGRALREHGSNVGVLPFPSHSCISFSAPRTISSPLLTPWLSDCFPVSQRIGEQAGMRNRVFEGRAGIQRTHPAP